MTVLHVQKCIILDDIKEKVHNFISLLLIKSLVHHGTLGKPNRSIVYQVRPIALRYPEALRGMIF